MLKRIESYPLTGSGEDLPVDLHPLLRRILLHRDLRHESDLATGLDQLLPANGLKGMDTALDLLIEALEGDWRILIIGDYDADGATSTAVAMEALSRFGASHVDYLVPNRFEYGYGLSPEIVAVAATRKPDLIITVDNGISSLEGVAAANRLGIKVLVTDHHLPAEALPAAEAIVNPNQPGDDFPSKSMAGVGV
ncbi:MAG: DHH family phosphoesterase, partial [Gammaproteobacteria bacterium]|nr:DHH family phosphoesterase [Gammaproteobacteria bacterium]